MAASGQLNGLEEPLVAAADPFGKKATGIGSSQIIRVFFSRMMFLFICNICEIKINFIRLWISPNASKSKILFEWLKNETELHSGLPLKRVFCLPGQTTDAGPPAPQPALGGWQPTDHKLLGRRRLTPGRSALR